MIRCTFNPQETYRYVRYGRMSNDEQNPRSPEQQYDQIEITRQRLGYPWRHVIDYRDDGVSGRILRKRQGFQKMLQDIRTREIVTDLILVDTFERAARADEMSPIRAELQNQHGVLILTADSNFADPTSVAGRALGFVEQIRAVEDGRVKAHNVLRGKRDLILQKKAWPGGPIPLGFKLKSILAVGKSGEQEVSHKVVIHDEESNWIAARIYDKARESGWGSTRLCKFFNADPLIPEKFKPFSPSQIAYILDNPIYHGELVWAQHSTGIVDDTRIIRRNPEDEVVHVLDFCEPTVTRELAAEVRDLRRKRGQQIIQRRQDRHAPTGKQIAPLVPGLTLKYLLTGIVRCAHCRASMRPSPSKRTSKSGEVWRRTYYVCPTYIGGACSNGRYVPEDSLRQAVIARLRARLLPLQNTAGEVPGWFGPLVEQVREALEQRTAERPDHRTAWTKEIEELQECLSGWAMSLAKPRLDLSLRSDIEDLASEARSQILQLESNLLQHERREEGLKELLDPQMVLGRLHRLAEVLGGNNPTAGNLELALHIDRIDCFSDGQILMRTCRLGAFEGGAELLNTAVEPIAGPSVPETKVNGQIVPRRRARHRIVMDCSSIRGQTTDVDRASDPRRFSGLEDQWFWVDSLEIPKTSSWAEQNAAEVGELRRSGQTIEQLAAHFGKTPPTIRRALALACVSDPSLKSLPRKMPRARWHERHATEVLKLKSEGQSTLAIARYFHKSDTTIRSALKHARGLKCELDEPS
jgi:site-specific DNA recombinase